jgi:hypothetical protein
MRRFARHVRRIVPKPRSAVARDVISLTVVTGASIDDYRTGNRPGACDVRIVEP